MDIDYDNAIEQYLRPENFISKEEAEEAENEVEKQEPITLDYMFYQMFPKLKKND